MSINILLVDDHKIMRDGLSAILKSEDDICIVAEAGDGREAIEMVREHSPDVVIMDLTLPDMGGMEATRYILAENPGIRVLVLTMYLDESCVFESVEVGARGYLVKDCASEELVSAVRAVYQGKPYFCAWAQEIMMRKCTPGSPDNPTGPTLTKRELEVLKLTALGNNTKEIAYALGVSVKMIEVHRMKLKRKLGVNSIAQLTTYALKIGLITT
jgi:DNA-binding NarL/FixJ family response regulator